jgi:Lysyl oxidase
MDPAYRVTATQRCREGQTAPTFTFQGISSGWRDVYGSNVYFQWIDISDVAPGLYRLGSQMDPDDFVKESNETNNGPTLASSTVTVPGYTASPVSSSGTGSRAITLTAQLFGSAGTRRFKIVTAPAHGTLD